MVRFHEVIKLRSFEFSMRDVIPTNYGTSQPRMHKLFHSWFPLHLLIGFIKNKPPINVCGVFDNFSQTYVVVKFWIISLCLVVKDVMHANEHKKHADIDLHLNFGYFLFMPIYFMMKMHHFKQKSLLFLQVPFKVSVPKKRQSLWRMSTRMLISW